MDFSGFFFFLPSSRMLFRGGATFRKCPSQPPRNCATAKYFDFQYCNFDFFYLGSVPVDRHRIVSRLKICFSFIYFFHLDFLLICCFYFWFNFFLFRLWFWFGKCLSRPARNCVTVKDFYFFYFVVLVFYFVILISDFDLDLGSVRVEPPRNWVTVKAEVKVSQIQIYNWNATITLCTFYLILNWKLTSRMSTLTFLWGIQGFCYFLFLWLLHPVSCKGVPTIVCRSKTEIGKCI